MKINELDKTLAVESVFSFIVRESLKQITFSSVAHHTGNSSIALAIAKRAVRSNRRVLFIEMNMDTPTLHLSEPLIRKEWLPLEGHWEHALQKTDSDPGLFFLTTPDKSGHCVEFRDLDILKAFYQSTATQFDLTIIDTSPLLQQTESSFPADLLCSVSESTFLNVLTNVTTESQVDEARQVLSGIGAKLTGVVMNDKYAPSLKYELIRETHRLDKLFPRWMESLRQKLRSSVLLNQEL